jgi:hypothetical protein
MSAHGPAAWMVRLLHLVPRPLLLVMDAWSYRIARERAARRRSAAR